ncbi:MAG: GIY-YIG nuclease family protein [Flavobacteriales bacterium]|nr:GIY-YIG nuclease family protein [Flavobacteriales bacterium]
MECYVYVLKSEKRNYLYVGLSYDPSKRIAQHNEGKEKTTRPYRPFTLIHLEKCMDRPNARIREKFWKSGTGKAILKDKLQNNGGQ